jgi:CIC family chloride channel protein
MQAPVAAIVLMIELTHHINTLMVPILLAVAGAGVVARRLDPRSVYSGRVAAGRKAAAAQPAAADEVQYARLLKRAEPRIISVAANYPEVLAALLGARARPLYAVDENGALAGRILARSAVSPPALTPVLSTAAACDLMEPVAALYPTVSEAEALARLDAEPAGELPVVDPDSGRLLGIASRS